ncbi:MAG: type I polyketide synthase, partial [bacterium]
MNPSPAQNQQETTITSDVPIAIVGMACLFPQADSPANFWSNILEGRDSIREVPMTHWLASDFFNDDPKAPDMTYSRQGAFLDAVDFAPLDFGIAPKNLEAIDTTQLLGLVVARDALADSGYGNGGKVFNRHRASVILGVTGTLEMVIPLGARLGHPIWRKSLAECGVDAETADKVVDRISEHYNAWQENSFPGLLGNVTAGRIANRLDLGGTNCVVDAACASSLGAVHLAQMELATRRADMVITGGFDTFNDIFMFMCFSKTPALSKTGHARPFDQKADGTSLGEGLGAVVLKRLDDAVRDGDRVYAVIRGVGTSSDGIGQAVYAPKAEGQVRCLKAAYQAAGVDPSTIELVEAHGTGTKVGDGIEVKALAEVYREHVTADAGRWCAVGSVKSQIGHTKAAAGVAGLIKAALSLHHKVIPPTIKVGHPAEEILAADSPFYVPTQPRPWAARPWQPRRAAVSAFGFGGSNFHAILEEAGPRCETIGWSDALDAWPISANSRAEVIAAVEAVPENATWKQIGRLAAHARSKAAASTGRHRLVILPRQGRDWAKLRDSIIAGLMKPETGSGKAFESPDGWHYSESAATVKLAMLFTGQGAQSVGMLRSAACRFPIVAQTLDEADQAAGRTAGTLVSKIYPTHLIDEQARAAADKAIMATEVAQPALAALGLGVARVLAEFGVIPQGVAGHSLGELTALAAAGRISPKQMHRLVEIRGREMALAATSANARQGKGGMLAVLANESHWAPLL